MSLYTRFGTAIWEWEPFIQLPYDARNLWLALYTSTEAKRIVPGLWHGSITAMAEAAHMPVDDCMKALDKLLEREMVEFDQKLRVLRLTMLPDAGESPANGNVIRGWFKKFKSVPACQVRDAHVPTLLWIMEQWVRENPEKGKLSEGHIAAWNETFSHVTVPPSRRRGIRRLIDSDTGTNTQPGLFDSRSSTGVDKPVDTVSDPSPPSDAAHEASAVPRTTLAIGSSSNSSILRSESIETHQSGNRSRTVSERFPNGLDQDPDRDRDLDLRSQREGGSGGGRPRLALVPPATESSANEAAMLLADIVSGLGLDARFAEVREGVQAGLRATFAELAAAGCTRDERIAMGKWLVNRMGHEVSPAGGEPWSRVSVWAATPGRAMQALTAIREQQQAVANVQDQLAAAKKALGIQ